MFNNGLKILNYAAGSMYEVVLGVRSNYDTTPAVLSNSLFLDFMLKNGLQVHNNQSTRSVICIDFNYGSRSYKDDVRHIEKLIENNPDDAEWYRQLKTKIDSNKDKYDKKSKAELREMFYCDGIDVYYDTYNRQGRVIKRQTIHYKRLCRTAGKAKQGKCMFIDSRLYQVARNFVTMGIKLPQHNAPVVELQAYSALIMSGIVGYVPIDPDSILILDDFDSYMTTDVVAVKTNDKKQCIAEHIHDYKLHNTMFDGQALIDDSIFPPWGDGYVLLRQHMFKAAAFRTYIQKFFRDYYGDKYQTAEIEDIFERKLKAKNIKLITTTNACKFLKFNVPYQHWKKYVNELNNMFGVVKTSHPSKLGQYQRMSYQMVNTLDIHMMDEAMRPTIEYIQKLKKDDGAFLEYLARGKNFSNDYGVLIKLVELDPDFVRSKYFRERRTAIISAYVKNIRSGRLLQNAENLTIVQSPFALLMWAVGQNPENDPTFNTEEDAIQCYTARFSDGEYLAGYRSPMNSRNNVDYLHNCKHKYFEKYFNLGKQIIAVNMVHTCFQDKNNGSDADGDFLYVTNNSFITEQVKGCQRFYPTIVNLLPKEKNHYQNNYKDLAIIDDKLGASQQGIGSSSNLAQYALSISYNTKDTKFDDYTCILSVLAQVYIDSSKRTYDVDLDGEMRRIREDLDIEKYQYPAFWRDVEYKQSKNTNFSSQQDDETLAQLLSGESTGKKSKQGKPINNTLRCPMNTLHYFSVPKQSPHTDTIPTEDFLNFYPYKGNKRPCKKVERLIQDYSLQLYKYNTGYPDAEGYYLLQDNFNQLIEDIRATHLSRNYLPLMSWLINRAFIATPELRGNKDKLKTRLGKNRSLLLKTLYDVNPEQFLQIFSKHLSAKNNKTRCSPEKPTRRKRTKVIG